MLHVLVFPDGLSSSARSMGLFSKNNSGSVNFSVRNISICSVARATYVSVIALTSTLYTRQRDI